MKKHLQGTNAYLAVVADPEGAKAFADALQAGAPSPVTYETETKAEVLAEDQQIATWPLTLSPGSIRIVPAADMFER